jgi:glyoxylase-like metal-dependent hydrolase (beta-lactamase superfamily II)
MENRSVSSEVHRYKVGDIGVTVLADGFRKGSPDGYILNATNDELLATLSEAGLPTDHMKNVYAPIVIETGGKRLLFDTGNGEAIFAQSKGERGRLQHNLAAAGLDRNAIDVVVISHFHADHVNGLLTADSTAAFPNAEIMVPEQEWIFWMDDGEMSRASKGRMTELFHNNRRVFDALGRKVTRYAWDRDVAPGVTAVGTPGHSIGHTSFVVSSGSAHVFVQGDVNNQAVVFSKHPEWHGGFDQDPAQASATRRRVYDMLATEKMPVQAYHHPFPGLGRVERDGAGFRVVPIA